MIKVNIKQKKGITMIALVLAIFIMIIITSILVYNIDTGLNTRELNNMYNDIEILKDRVDIYYSKFGAIPIIDSEYTNVENIKSINNNDGAKYYVIDLEQLENLTLTYGKDYSKYKISRDNSLENIYVINGQSHTIYYIAGKSLDGNIYYTIPGEYTKIEIPNINIVKLKEINQNRATIELRAVDKVIGLQSVKLYVNDKEYKTFSYTNKHEPVTELVDIILPFYEDTTIYISVTNTDGQVTNSESMQVKNEKYIATVQDMKNFANTVNNGNTFENENVYLMNDIDLEGDATNKWTPIGNNEHPFNGTFEGNNKTVSGLFINSSSDNQGFFGYNNGTIKNIKINGNVTCSGNNAGILLGYNRTTGNVSNVITSGQISGVIRTGGVVGFNCGQIEKCGNLAKVTSTSNYTGGITGTTYNGKVSKCYNKGEISGSAYVRRNNGMCISIKHKRCNNRILL